MIELSPGVFVRSKDDVLAVRPEEVVVDWEPAGFSASPVYGPSQKQSQVLVSGVWIGVAKPVQEVAQLLSHPQQPAALDEIEGRDEQ